MAFDDHFAGLADFRIQNSCSPAGGASIHWSGGQRNAPSSRSCSASDNLFSTSRAIPCQCSGSASQSGRLATKVQVRICAIRPDSVSISPSTRSAWSTWAREPGVGNAALLHQEAVERGHQLGMGGRRQPPVIRDLAGLPQPFHGGRAMRHVAHLAVAGGVVEHAHVLGDRRAGQRLWPGDSASDTCSAPSEAKSSLELRHCSILTLSKVWFCSALTSSGSNGAQRPVVPKVPLRVARPARPAICANSDGVSRRNW